MKQSQNAITFLKAQYSAIYGRAYVKGLASVMVLSSAVAANYAQAANITDTGNTWDQATDFSTGGTQQPPMTAGDTYNLSQGSFDNITANDADHDVNLNNVQLKGTLNVQPDATVNIRNNLFSWDHATTGMDGANAAEGDLDTSGKVTIGSTGNSSQAYFNEVNLQSGSSVQISNKFDSNQTLNQHSSLTGGLGPNGSFNAAAGSSIGLNSNSNITIGATSSDAQFDGKVVFRPTEQGSDSYIRVKDDFNGTVANTNDAAWGNTAPSAQANLKFGESSEITVKNSTSGTAGIYAPNAELGGKVTIGSGGTLRLDGDFIYDNDTAANAQHGKGNFTTTANTNINIVSGGKLVVGNGSYANAPDYDPNNAAYQGETTVDLSKGHITGTGTLEVQGTAILTDSVLDDFVQADVSNTTTQGGKVVLSGGTLELGSSNINNPVNLSNYHISANSTSRNDVDILLSGNGDDVIKGENVVIDKAFDSSVKDKLNIEADNLTLGSTTGNNNKTLNFKQATVSNSVEFVKNASANDFRLHDKLIINAVDNGNSDQATSAGDVTVYQNALDVNDTNFQVQAGTITHERGTFGLSSGKMIIGGVTDTSSNAYGKDASFVLANGTTLRGRGDSQVNVLSNGNGAVSTLDLRNTTKIDVPASSNNAHKIVFNVGSSNNSPITNSNHDAELVIQKEQLGELFRIDAAGSALSNIYKTGVVLDGQGALRIEGSTPTDPVKLGVNLLNVSSSQTQYNGIYFKDGGSVETDNLLLTQNEGSSAADPNLNIGKGTLSADTIEIQKRFQRTPMVIETGTLEAGTRLSSAQPDKTALMIGSGSTTVDSGGANVNLGKFDYALDPNTNQYKVSGTPTQAGSIGTDIIFNAAANSGAAAQLNVQAGTWTLDDGRKIEFSGTGTINVGAQLSPDQQNYQAPVLSDNSALKATLDLSKQDLTINSGSALNVNNNGTIRVNNLVAADGANVKFNGDVNINSGTFTGTNALDGSGNLFVGEVGYDPASGNPYPEANVAFNKANLESFVGTNQQAEGHVVLKNNSTLDLSSETSQEVTLNEYSFAAYDESTGTAPIAQISVDAEAVNAEAATGAHIKGDKLIVNAPLADGSALNLALEANDLTLGGGTDYVSADPAQNIGFSHATVHNSATFTPDAGTNTALSLGAGVDFVAVDDQGTEKASSSSGDVILSGNEHGYNVKVGNVTHSGAMTLDNANITVGGDDTYAGKDASLTFSGAQATDKVYFTINNTNGENKITIAGNGNMPA